MVELLIRSEVVARELAEAAGNAKLSGYAALTKLEEERDALVAMVDTLREWLAEDEEPACAPLQVLVASFDHAAELEAKRRRRVSHVLAKSETKKDWTRDESTDAHVYVMTWFTLRAIGHAIARERKVLQAAYAKVGITPAKRPAKRRRAPRRAT